MLEYLALHMMGGPVPTEFYVAVPRKQAENVLRDFLKGEGVAGATERLRKVRSRARTPALRAPPRARPRRSAIRARSKFRFSISTKTFARRKRAVPMVARVVAEVAAADAAEARRMRRAAKGAGVRTRTRPIPPILSHRRVQDGVEV